MSERCHYFLPWYLALSIALLVLKFFRSAFRPQPNMLMKNYFYLKYKICLYLYRLWKWLMYLRPYRSNLAIFAKNNMFSTGTLSSIKFRLLALFRLKLPGFEIFNQDGNSKTKHHIFEIVTRLRDIFDQYCQISGFSHSKDHFLTRQHDLCYKLFINLTKLA